MHLLGYVQYTQQLIYSEEQMLFSDFCMRQLQNILLSPGVCQMICRLALITLMKLDEHVIEENVQEMCIRYLCKIKIYPKVKKQNPAAILK